MNTNNAVLNHQIKKQIASIDALRIMENSIKLNKFKLSGGVIYSGDLKFDNTHTDREDAAKHLKDFQRNYDKSCPESLDINTQNAMWKRAKQLKDEFTVGMLSKDELHPIKGMMIDGTMKWVVDYEKIASSHAIDRNSQWYKANADRLAEYKNIMRHLCPKDASAPEEEQVLRENNYTDVEKFRPHGGHG